MKITRCHFVTVECLYRYKQAIADGIKRIVKP